MRIWTAILLAAVMASCCGKPPTIKDRTEQDKEIELVVADTGVGIDPADQELVFEKFFRTADPILHSTGDTKFMGAGPGLGLAIARGIVEAHGGMVEAISKGLDHGSTFTITLPLQSYPAQSAVFDERHRQDVD